MRLLRYLSSMGLGRVVGVAAVCALVGCNGAGEAYVVPEGPMPANTVMLAQMMRELSGRPGFTEAVLAEMEKGGKVGAAYMTPALMQRLREMILGKDWQGLDRFPGWTMRAINPTVRVVGHVAGKDATLEDVAARHPGSQGGVSTQQATKISRAFLDLGPYSLEKAERVSLDEPSALPGFATEGIVSELGAGVVRGDGAGKW